MATTTFNRDFLWRKIQTPGSNAVNYLGQACTSTADSSGRALFAVACPTSATAVTLGTKYQHSAGPLLEVTVAGTTGASEPTLPGSVGGTVVSGTATYTRITGV